MGPTASSCPWECLRDSMCSVVWKSHEVGILPSTAITANSFLLPFSPHRFETNQSQSLSIALPSARVHWAIIAKGCGHTCSARALQGATLGQGIPSFTFPGESGPTSARSPHNQGKLLCGVILKRGLDREVKEEKRMGTTISGTMCPCFVISLFQ
jgi:hypothetical protein